MASAKKRLGRGLGNLISSGAQPAKQDETSDGKAPALLRPHLPQSASAAPVPTAPATTDTPSTQPGAYRELLVTKVSPSPYQARRDIDDEQIRSLAESIRSEGLLQPIVVRDVGQGAFQLIAGERRWRAHQLLGVKRIMARIIDASDASAAVISMIENLQREDLNPIEESLGYASLMSDFDLTQEAVAERVGRSRASVANALRLLQLDREIQGYLSKGMLSVGHAKVLLGLEDPAHRSLLARRVIESGMSVRDLEREIKKLRTDGMSSQQRQSRESNAETSVINNLERELSSALSTRVTLKHTPKKGKIIIEYYGNDDLQRILEKTGLHSAS